MAVINNQFKYSIDNIMNNSNSKGILILMCLILMTFIKLSESYQFRNTNRVYAAMTNQVKYSSIYDSYHQYYFLDFPGALHMARAWCVRTSDLNQWIQVSTPDLKIWNSVITQGRGDCCQQWVTSYKLTYSIDGYSFLDVDGGRVFGGNFDQHTKIQHSFRQPVSARVIRLHPLSWHNHICLRWDAIYLN